MRSLSQCSLSPVLAGCLFASGLAAQFGGTGADGAFAPTRDVTLTTSLAGWNFTSINIPSGVTVRLSGSHPAILRSTGRVSIAGALVADGFEHVNDVRGIGGPGGFAGGHPGFNGEGPAGGFASISRNGTTIQFGSAGGHATPGTDSWHSPRTGTYGTIWPFDLRGGSGGGGASTYHAAAWTQIGGDGGGGTVVILADDVVQVDGSITADGGGEAQGAGGAIFVRSATDVVIRGALSADGGHWTHAFWQRSGGDGRIRVDAWGEVPDVRGASFEPAPSLFGLPRLDVDAPRVGRTWTMTAEATHGDSVAFLLSTRRANIAIPGFGTLGLDPVAGVFHVGTARVGAVGVEPEAVVQTPVPANPNLVGIALHTQAVALTTSSAEGPRLSNVVSSTIQR